MANRILNLAAALVLASVGIARRQDAPAETAQARQAIERSLPFLEKEGVAWMNEKKCASCHNVPFLLWSHNAARARGIAIDEKKLAEWTDWTWKFSQSRRGWFKLTSDSLNKGGDALPSDVLAKLKPAIDKPFATEKELLEELGRVLTREELDQHQAALVKRAARPREPDNDGGGLDTLSQFLLGRAQDSKDKKVAEFVADVRDLMLRWQQPDGSWNAAGQLPAQSRPKSETNAVTTMWAALALASLDNTDAPANKGPQRAVNLAAAIEPGKSTEWINVALLVEHRFGQPERADALLHELQSRQNSDGGWAWKQAGDSNAFATGQTLYALHECGQSTDNALLQRAQRFLIQSQADDGSWPDASRGISSAANEVRLKKAAPIYRYWGTAWAVIGLSQTLPEVAVPQPATQNARAATPN